MSHTVKCKSLYISFSPPSGQLEGNVFNVNKQANCWVVLSLITPHNFTVLLSFKIDYQVWNVFVLSSVFSSFLFNFCCDYVEFEKFFWQNPHQANCCSVSLLFFLAFLRLFRLQSSFEIKYFFMKWHKILFEQLISAPNSKPNVKRMGTFMQFLCTFIKDYSLS